MTSQALTKAVARVADCNPPWLNYPLPHLRGSLYVLSCDELRAASSRVSIHHTAKKHYDKTICVDIILEHFDSCRTSLISCSLAFLQTRLQNLNLTVSANMSRFEMITTFFETMYGNPVALALRKSSWPIQGSFSIENDSIHGHMPWLTADLSPWMNRLPRKLLLGRLKSCLQSMHPSTRPMFKSSSKQSCWHALLRHLKQRGRFLFCQTDEYLIEQALSAHLLSSMKELTRASIIRELLEAEYGTDLLDELSRPFLTRQQAINNSVKMSKMKKKFQERMTTFRLVTDIHASWPHKISREIVFKRLNEYLQGTLWSLPPPCAVCSRQIHETDVISLIVDGNTSSLPHHLDMLIITDPFIIQKCIVQCNSAEFVFGHKTLDGLMLYKPAVHLLPGGNACLDVCAQCHSSLNRNVMPKFALANDLYRGQLPSQFTDLTWVEEMVCARFRYTAHITRLFQSSDPALPNVLHGNTCAHEMNVVSTASVLPRTPSDINETLSVVFVGPGKFRREFLKDVYRIRKRKVWSFLTWLTSHNVHYLDMHLDKTILDQYPEDDMLPGITDNVIEDHASDVSQIFLEETAGPSEHPAELLKVPPSEADEPFVFLEKVGVSDPEGDRLSGRTFVSRALRNLVSDMGNSTLPDLILHRGSTAIKEYKNPELMPGMFPTLWPFGIGGFENPVRSVSLSFPIQANYYFDLPDRSFRTHNSFLFVALNIIQRRAAHLHTHFTVRKRNFPSVAEKLITVTPEVLLSTAQHLEHEGKYQNLTDEQQNAMNLLKSVNAVSARIPGSHASQIHIRNEIRNYFGYFGMPHLYFTANPSATHSPIFQVMCGDTNVDLTKRFPQIVPSRERALRLAKDPVAAADFFDFSIKCIFKHLFGWDYSKKESSPEGGILGHLRAFYGTAELTERANFHGHFLLWLRGGLNPSQLHERFADDEGFKHRFFEFFEDIIHHHLPQNDGINIDPAYEPRIERPPHPPDPNEAVLDELRTWDSAFITQIKVCGEALQRHVCRPVCHKYGNEGRCRFLFPHEIIEASQYWKGLTSRVWCAAYASLVRYYSVDRANLTWNMTNTRRNCLMRLPQPWKL